MELDHKQLIYFLDDEEGIRDTATKALKSLGCRVQAFNDPLNCLQAIKQISPNLLISDVKMQRMDGLTLLTEVKKVAPWVSVMLITGYADIPMATRAIKAGAIDFIEKPLDRTMFLQRVKKILKNSCFEENLTGEPLTDAEIKVLNMILQGKSNKEIAHALGRSSRTIEVHRSHIMQKFNVDNIVKLVKKPPQCPF